MTTPNANEAAAIETMNFASPASVPSTLVSDMRIGKIAAVENTNVLLGLLLVAGVGLFFCGQFRVPDLAGLIGALALCGFVIARAVVLAVKKHEFRAFSIIVMALLVTACALARWEFLRLLQS